MGFSSSSAIAALFSDPIGIDVPAGKVTASAAVLVGCASATPCVTFPMISRRPAAYNSDQHSDPYQQWACSDPTSDRYSHKQASVLQRKCPSPPGAACMHACRETSVSVANESLLSKLCVGHCAFKNAPLFLNWGGDSWLHSQ